MKTAAFKPQFFVVYRISPAGPRVHKSLKLSMDKNNQFNWQETMKIPDNVTILFSEYVTINCFSKLNRHQKHKNLHDTGNEKIQKTAITVFIIVPSDF